MSKVSDGYQKPVLVSTGWVAEHQNDPKVRLVEVDVDTTAYGRGHPRNAVGWNWSSQLEDNVRRDIPPKEAWERLLGQSGIDNNTTIVFYGDNNNWFATFAYWLAKMFGHQEAYIMNGGRKKWELEGRELVTEVPQFPPQTYRAQDADLSLRAFQPQVLEFSRARRGPLVDVRSPAEFTGDIIAPPGLPETAQRAGHIPGAVNIPWGLVVNEDGTFKSADELRQLYQGKGVTPERDVIVYCRIGERSSHTWFVLHELLGYTNVRNYDGSWTEWGSMIGVPIENPSAPAA